MIYLIILDYIISSITKYNLHLFLILLPKLKDIKYIYFYLLILSFFEYRYLLNIVLIFIICFFIKMVYKRFKQTRLVYMFLVVFTYLIYVFIPN